MAPNCSCACAVGLVDETSYEWPLPQAGLGATTGLSTVRVRRTLQELRAQGSIALAGRKPSILNFDRLRDASLFDPQSLHLDRKGQGFYADRVQGTRELQKIDAPAGG